MYISDFVVIIGSMCQCLLQRYNINIKHTTNFRSNMNQFFRFKPESVRQNRYIQPPTIDSNLNLLRIVRHLGKIAHGRTGP